MKRRELSAIFLTASLIGGCQSERPSLPSDGGSEVAGAGQSSASLPIESSGIQELDFEQAYGSLMAIASGEEVAGQPAIYEEGLLVKRLVELASNNTSHQSELIGMVREIRSPDLIGSFYHQVLATFHSFLSWEEAGRIFTIEELEAVEFNYRLFQAVNNQAWVVGKETWLRYSSHFLLSDQEYTWLRNNGLMEAWLEQVGEGISRCSNHSEALEIGRAVTNEFLGDRRGGEVLDGLVLRILDEAQTATGSASGLLSSGEIAGLGLEEIGSRGPWQIFQDRRQIGCVTYLNPNTGWFLRVDRSYVIRGALLEDLSTFRRGLVWADSGTAEGLIKPVLFNGEIGIMSPNLGVNLSWLSDRLGQARIPPTFFREFLLTLDKLVDSGVEIRDLRLEDIVVHFREGKLLFSFIDPGGMRSFERADQLAVARIKAELRNQALSLISSRFGDYYSEPEILAAGGFSRDDLLSLGIIPDLDPASEIEPIEGLSQLGAVGVSPAIVLQEPWEQGLVPILIQARNGSAYQIWLSEEAIRAGITAETLIAQGVPMPALETFILEAGKVGRGVLAVVGGVAISEAARQYLIDAWGLGATVQVAVDDWCLPPEEQAREMIAEGLESYFVDYFFPNTWYGLWWRSTFSEAPSMMMRLDNPGRHDLGPLGSDTSSDLFSGIIVWSESRIYSPSPLPGNTVVFENLITGEKAIWTYTLTGWVSEDNPLIVSVVIPSGGAEENYYTLTLRLVVQSVWDPESETYVLEQHYQPVWVNND
jgi:hypothetical protein